jgi:dihydroceramidase
MAPNPNLTGYWSPSTATLDWCENNYEVTKYVAEFWNTLSNLAMIVPPLYSYVCSIKHRNPVELRFVMAYFTVLLVGIGSWAFHMTLRYEMQLFDELPMMWGSLLLVYVLITIIRPHLDNSLPLQAGLVAYGVFCTYAYLQFVYPIIFQVRFY